MIYPKRDRHLELIKSKPNYGIGNKDVESILYSQSGRIGYLVAWVLGVPASLLLLIFLIRGH